MANHQPTSIIFKGIHADEAESFIQAIRKAAYDENKSGDDAWMANLATTCFRGRAMRWHARLERAVQQDWYLLVQAILDEWQSDGEGHSSVGVQKFVASIPSPAIH